MQSLLNNCYQYGETAALNIGRNSNVFFAARRIQHIGDKYTMDSSSDMAVHGTIGEYSDSKTGLRTQNGSKIISRQATWKMIRRNELSF